MNTEEQNVRPVEQRTSAGSSTAGRRTWLTVSGSKQYFSRAVQAGNLLFLSGNAFDGDGNPLPGAVPAPPYHLSESAHCVAQTKALYDQYRPVLDEVGAAFPDTVQIEQYMPHKVYGDPYVNTSRGPGYLERNRPTSALLVTGDLPLDGQTIAHTGIVAIPGENASKEIVGAQAGFTADTVNSDYGDSWAEEPPFHEVVTAGPRLFTVGDMAMDWEKGVIPDGVRVQQFTYWGSEIRNETEYLLGLLASYTERVGGTLADIAHVSIYLTDPGDLFELDRVWRKFFGDAPPARTVVPVRAHGSPRHEAPGQGHAENAPKLEHITQGVVPGRGMQREIVPTGYQPLGHESVAIRVGDLVWVSQQYARDDESLAGTTGDRVSEASAGDTATQLDVIFERLARIAVEAGTNLSQAVRIRAFFVDSADNALLATKLRTVFPTDPPTVMTTGVGGPLLLPGARVSVDAILHAP